MSVHIQHSVDHSDDVSLTCVVFCRCDLEHAEETASSRQVRQHLHAVLRDEARTFGLNVLFVCDCYSEKHEEFGDVKKVVTDEFVRQR